MVIFYQRPSIHRKSDKKLYPVKEKRFWVHKKGKEKLIIELFFIKNFQFTEKVVKFFIL